MFILCSLPSPRMDSPLLVLAPWCCSRCEVVLTPYCRLARASFVTFWRNGSSGFNPAKKNMRLFYLADFRRKIIKVSHSPLLTQEDIVTAPVLNALCHWDCGQFEQRTGLEMKLSRCLCAWGRLWKALPGCPCEGAAVGSWCRDAAAGAGFCVLGTTHSSGHEGTAGRDCDCTPVTISSINESPNERKEPLLNQALLALSTCEKCFSIERWFLCSALGFIPMMFKDIISHL